MLFEKRDFAGALSAPGLSVVSEIKRASPSAGFIREADPAEWGRPLRVGGRELASPSSPSPNASREVSKTSTPRAAKPRCRYCAKTSPSTRRRSSRPGPGPTPSFSIAALFDAAALARYVSLAVEVGLTPLVEIHDEEEANLALESGARVIGVNNRDLRDFTVDLGTFERLAPRLAGATLVAESGIKSPEDARRLRDAGADAVLVGEAAMRDPGLVARLASVP